MSLTIAMTQKPMERKFYPLGIMQHYYDKFVPCVWQRWFFTLAFLTIYMMRVFILGRFVFVTCVMGIQIIAMFAATLRPIDCAKFNVRGEVDLEAMDGSKIESIFEAEPFTHVCSEPDFWLLKRTDTISKCTRSAKKSECVSHGGCEEVMSQLEKCNQKLDGIVEEVTRLTNAMVSGRMKFNEEIKTPAVNGPEEITTPAGNGAKSPLPPSTYVNTPGKKELKRKHPEDSSTSPPSKKTKCDIHRIDPGYVQY